MHVHGKDVLVGDTAQTEGIVLETIILEDFGVFLGKKGERFVVKKGKKTVAEFPAIEVERIVVTSSGASVSSAALLLATKNRVPVSFAYRSGRPFAFVTPTQGHGTVLTRRAQYEHADDEVAMSIVTGLIRGKMLNQLYLLRAWGKNRLRTDRTAAEVLLQLSEEIDSLIPRLEGVGWKLNSESRQGIMNTEALAAISYWAGVARILPREARFSGRTTRGAKDFFNMCLNYGYGILYSEVWSAVTNAGLDPFAGFLHVDRPGRPSLVLDVIEEFRQQVVDRVLVTLCVRGSLRPSDDSGHPELEKRTREEIASAIVTRLSEKVTYSGTKTAVKNVLRRQSWNIARVLKGESRTYDPFVLKW
jgi:CRISPR-associated protein Cas1